MQARLQPLGILSLFLLLASCSTQVTPGAFLAENVNKIGQEEIIKAWGPPESTKELTDGGAVWVYRYARKGTLPRVAIPPTSPSPYGGGYAGGFARPNQPELIPGTPDICRHFTLTFDRSGILREYNEVDCGP